MKTRLLLLAAVLSMSTSSIAVRYSSAPSAWLAFARLLLSAFLMLPLVLTRYRDELRGLTPKTVARFALAGTMLAFHFLCYFEAVQYTSVAACVVLASTEIFFVTFGARRLFKEKTGKGEWIGILAAFAGAVLVTTAQSSAAPDALRGNLYALLAAIFAAVYTLIGKQARASTSTVAYTFVVYCFSTAVLLIACMAARVPILQQEPINWLYALWMAGVCTMMGHSLISYCLRFEKASVISSMKLLAPVFAAVLSWLMLGEIPVPQVIMGSVVIIGGILCFNHYSSPQPLR